MRTKESFSLSEATSKQLKTLARALDLPSSRIVDQALRARFASMSAEERAAVEALRASDAALAAQHEA